MSVHTLGPAGISRPLAMAAMLGSAACWGGATVMTKGALDAFDPLVLLPIQLGASVSVLWLATLLWRIRLPDRRRMARAGSTGVFEPGLAYAIGVPGLAMTTAGNASVIAALEPVFIFLGAWLLFGTRLGLPSVAAVGTAIIGVVLVSLTHAADLGGGSVAGDGLILLATGFAAVYVLASSRLALSMPAVLLTALQQSVGLVFVLVLTAIALLIGWQSLPGAVTGPMLALAVLSGLIQYALAFWLYIVGLKGVPPGLAGMFLTTTPIFGVLGGVLVLGESFAPSQLAGMALVVLSLLYIIRSSDRAA
jgi:drug/metabolite transporter (DMT)-like permease